MIIDALTTLPSNPTTGDELPIERGTDTYKIDYDTLATAIINKLGTVLKPSDVVNDLNSTDPTKVLAAPQGKALNDMMPKSTTLSITPNATGLISFAGIVATNIISAISNGYIILVWKNSTGAWRGLVTDSSLNVVTSQPTISVNVLYY